MNYNKNDERNEDQKRVTENKQRVGGGGGGGRRGGGGGGEGEVVDGSGDMIKQQQ